MINPKIFKAVLMAATKETKDKILEEVLNHVSIGYDYNDEQVAHFMAMLVDSSEIVTPNKVNLFWLEHNLDYLIYNSNKFNIKNITVNNIDNIDGIINFTFDYIDKINEDRDDIEYSCGNTNISFIDHPEILK